MYRFSRSHWAERVTLPTAVIVGVLGITALVGWHLHLIALFQILPTLVPTQRMTALGFVLIGVAMFAAVRGHRAVSVIGALIVLVLAFLVCLEYALNVSFGIDQLLGPDYINVHTSNLGRMSPVTALCLLGSCVAVLAIAKPALFRNSAAVCGILASVLIAVSTVNGLFIWQGQPGTYGWSHLTRMSLHTSAAFAFFGVGLFAWAWGETPSRNIAPNWLPLGIGLGLASGALGVYQALITHQEADFPLLSGIILAGSLVGAFLVAFTVAQTVRAKNSSRELQEGKDVLERVFEAPPDALLLIDRRGHIVHVNRRIEPMFGYRPGELLGASVEILVPSRLRERYRVLLESYYASPSPRPLGPTLDLRALRKDGSQFPVEISLGPVESGGQAQVLVVVRDITDRRQAQEELRLSEERFRGIFEQSPIGLTLIGPDHRMIRVNPAFCRMLGYSEHELTRMTPLDITHPDDIAPSIKALEQVFAGATSIDRKIEKRYVKKCGEVIWGTLSATVVRDQRGQTLYGLGMVEDITERIRAERKLRQQAALLDLVQDAVIVRDLDARIIFWNQRATDTYGWRPEEVVGRVTHDLWQTRFPFPLKEIEAAVSTQGHWKGELQHTSRDGKTIVVDSRWSLQRDERGRPIAVLEVNRDITRRKRADEQLRNVTERLSLATRTASIGIWDLDWRSKQAVWDDTSFEIFGMNKVIPVAYADFVRRVHPDDLTVVEASLQRAIEAKAQDSVEFRIIRPDGVTRHVSSVQGAVRDEHNNVVRLVGTLVDITERKEMEEQIEASREHMAASAQLSALGMMAGGVSHEINNPLAIIDASASDLLRQAKEEGAVSPAIAVRNSQRILENTDRITRIIKSLRQLSREGSQDRVCPVSVGKIVGDTLEVCRERFKHNSVQLFAPHVDPGLTVLGREVQVGQVLLNLLQNAFDGVANQAGEKWIRLEVTEDGGSVVFSVIDSGPGVPPELRNKVMEPFFTTNEVANGTGLGLSLSRTILEEHSSKLELTEKAGHPCFSFSLALPQKEQLECY